MTTTTPRTRPTLNAIWLGLRPYRPVHELQQRFSAARQRGDVVDTVFFLEHEPVITLGRSAKEQHIVSSESELKRRGVDVVRTGRGGDVTLHAPGQLVCYPIVDLSPDRKDVRAYVKALTEVMRRLAADYGVMGGPAEKMIGLWVDRTQPDCWDGPESAIWLAKLGAIGVRISRWVTMHGFALNLATDLSLFETIVPCGISDHGVTSVARLTGSAPSVLDAAKQGFIYLAEALDATPGDFQDGSRITASELEELPRGLVPTTSVLP